MGSGSSDVIDDLATTPVLRDAAAWLMWDVFYSAQHGNLRKFLHGADVERAGLCFIEEPRGCFRRIPGSAEVSLSNWEFFINEGESVEAAGVAAAAVCHAESESALDLQLGELRIRLAGCAGKSERLKLARFCLDMLDVLPTSYGCLVGAHVVLPVLFSSVSAEGLALDGTELRQIVTEQRRQPLVDAMCYATQLQTTTPQLRGTYRDYMKVLRELRVSQAHDMSSARRASVASVGPIAPAVMSIVPSTATAAAAAAATALKVSTSLDDDSIDDALSAGDEPLPGQLSAEDADAIVAQMDDTSLPRSATEAAALVLKHFNYWTSTNEQTARSNAAVFAALPRLGAELYGQATHFLYELVQNSDDTHYDAAAHPTLTFRLDQRQSGGPLPEYELCVKSNELGFRKKDVDSICTVANSTKGRTDASAESIGNKGIGWKSVFAASKTPEVHSGYLHFVLDIRPEADGGLGNKGHITPQPVKNHAGTRTPGTRVVLPLGQAADLVAPVKVREALDKLASSPAVLLFLNKLRRLQFQVHQSTGGAASASVTVTLERLPDEQLGASAVDGHTASIASVRTTTRLMAETSKTDRWLRCTNADLTLAFPLLPQLFTSVASTAPVPTQLLFCFLPLDDYALPFVLQAKFDLPSTRESIREGSIHNQHVLLTALPRAFVAAFASFRAALPRLRELFVPSPAGTSNDEPLSIVLCRAFLAFLPLKERVRQGIAAQAAGAVVQAVRRELCCLPSAADVDQLAKPTQAVRAPAWFGELRASTDETAQHVLLHKLADCGLDAATADRLLGRHLVHADVALLGPVWSALDVPEWSVAHAVDVLRRACAGPSAVHDDRDGSHGSHANHASRAARFIAWLNLLRMSRSKGTAASEPLLQQLAGVEFVPLRSGGHTALAKDSVYYIGSDSDEQQPLADVIRVLEEAGVPLGINVLDGAVADQIGSGTHPWLKDMLATLHVSQLKLLTLIDGVVLRVLADHASSNDHLVAAMTAASLWYNWQWFKSRDSMVCTKSVADLLKKLKDECLVLTADDPPQRRRLSEGVHLHSTLLESINSHAAVLARELETSINAAVQPILWHVTSGRYPHTCLQLLQHLGVDEGFCGVPLMPLAADDAPVPPWPREQRPAFVPSRVEAKMHQEKPTTIDSVELRRVFESLPSDAVGAYECIFKHLAGRMNLGVVQRSALADLLRQARWIPGRASGNEIGLYAPHDCYTSDCANKLGNWGVYVTCEDVPGSLAEFLGIHSNVSPAKALQVLQKLMEHDPATADDCVAVLHADIASPAHQQRSATECGDLPQARVVVSTEQLQHLYSAALQDYAYPVFKLPLFVPAQGASVNATGNKRNAPCDIAGRFVRLDEHRVVSCDASPNGISMFWRLFDVWNINDDKTVLQQAYPRALRESLNEWTIREGMVQVWTETMTRLYHAARNPTPDLAAHGIHLIEDTYPTLQALVFAMYDALSKMLPSMLPFDDVLDLPLVVFATQLVEPQPAPTPVWLSPRLVAAADCPILVLDSPNSEPERQEMITRMRECYKQPSMARARARVLLVTYNSGKRADPRGRKNVIEDWFRKCPAARAVVLHEDQLYRGVTTVTSFNPAGGRFDVVRRFQWALACATMQHHLCNDEFCKHLLQQMRERRFGEALMSIAESSESRVTFQRNLEEEWMARRPGADPVLVYTAKRPAFLDNVGDVDSKHEDDLVPNDDDELHAHAHAERPIVLRLALDDADDPRRTSAWLNAVPDCFQAIVKAEYGEKYAKVHHDLVRRFERLHGVLSNEETRRLDSTSILGRVMGETSATPAEPWYAFDEHQPYQVLEREEAERLRAEQEDEIARTRQAMVSIAQAQLEDEPLPEPESELDRRERDDMIRDRAEIAQLDKLRREQNRAKREQEAATNAAESLPFTGLAGGLPLDPKPFSAVIAATPDDEQLPGASRHAAADAGDVGTRLPSTAPTSRGERDSEDSSEPDRLGARELDVFAVAEPQHLEQRREPLHDRHGEGTRAIGDWDLTGRAVSSHRSGDGDGDALSARQPEQQPQEDDEEMPQPSSRAQLPKRVNCTLTRTLPAITAEAAQLRASADQAGGAAGVSTTGDQALAALVGRLGEAYVAQELSEQPEVGRGEVDVVWENERHESGCQYDIRVVDRHTGTVLRYIEVKTTMKVDSSLHFPVSMHEVAFGMQHRRRWEIVLVVGLGVDTANCVSIQRMLRISDPAASINQVAPDEAEGRLGLVLTCSPPR